MSAPQTAVTDTYTTGSLLERYVAGMRAAGHDPDRAGPEDLEGGDEFHIGGAEATIELLNRAGLGEDMHVLDVGAGIGGPARLAARHYGCRVTGVDLTPEFVTTAQALTRMLGQGDRVEVVEGSGTDLPMEDGAVDAAYMIHVGMNIADKPALFAEVARVLKPEGSFAVYDIMRDADGSDLTYPLPWAMTPDSSFVAAPADYAAAAAGAGFSLESQRNRGDYGRAFFRTMAERMTANGPPPLGSHLMMGETAGERLGNVRAMLEARRIAPVEMIFRKAAP